MAEILVLVTVDGGRVTKPALELLTLARRIGEPAAVVFDPDVDTDVLARYGARAVYTFEGPEYADFLVAPKAEALAALVADRQPAGLLVTSTTEGKEIAARVALRSGAGFVYDAVDVLPGEQGTHTVQSVFAGNYTVTSAFTQGATAVIAVKPNATTPTEAPADGNGADRGSHGVGGGQGCASHCGRVEDSRFQPPGVGGGGDRRLRRTWHGRGLLTNRGVCRRARRRGRRVPGGG